MESVGDTIRKIRIGHDNSGMRPGWHLSWVEIRVLQGQYDSLCYHFECNRWLARDEDDKALERELNPSKVWAFKYDESGNLDKTEKTVEKLSLKLYTVHVYTGSVSGKTRFEIERWDWLYDVLQSSRLLPSLDLKFF